MRFIALALVFVASGCVTASLGRAPSDGALANDGSPAAMDKLQKRYALGYSNGFLTRPAASLEDVSKEVELTVDEASAPAWSDEAADYLGTSELATDATETSAVGFDRFAHSGTPVLILQAGGVLVGATVGIVNEVATSPSNEGGIDAVNGVANAAFNGMFTGLILALPLVIIYQWTVPSLSASLAKPDYRKGVRAYNKELELRIRKQARGAVAPTDATPPAVAPPPPPVETPPGG